MLVGPTWVEVAERLESVFPEPLLGRARAGISLRSRFAEDWLQHAAAQQYVILGAGLDSFAWRRPDAVGTLRVVEVDHPASQEWKRARVAELGLPVHEHHMFVPLDFEHTSLRGLDRTEFEWDRTTTFSWLGVTPYLSLEAIEETLRTIATARSGSSVVFSYAPLEQSLADADRDTIAILAQVTASSREPLRSFFSPPEIEALVQRCGLRVEDHPEPAELVRRYFAGRSDALEPWGVARLVTATVP